MHNKRLEECLKEGDAVHLIVEKAPANCGAKWSAKQILVTDESTSELRQIFKPNEKWFSFQPNPEKGPEYLTFGVKCKICKNEVLSNCWKTPKS